MSLPAVSQAASRRVLSHNKRRKQIWRLASCEFAFAAREWVKAALPAAGPLPPTADSSLVAGSASGYHLFALTPDEGVEEIYASNSGQDTCLVDRLFSSSLVAIVTVAAPRESPLPPRCWSLVAGGVPAAVARCRGCTGTGYFRSRVNLAVALSGCTTPPRARRPRDNDRHQFYYKFAATLASLAVRLIAGEIIDARTARHSERPRTSLKSGRLRIGEVVTSDAASRRPCLSRDSLRIPSYANECTSIMYDNVNGAVSGPAPHRTWHVARGARPLITRLQLRLRCVQLLAASFLPLCFQTNSLPPRPRAPAARHVRLEYNLGICSAR
ncbi:hypothetical protein MSG28_004402 [Choristoneura fumiferana]|uniref:Uncharacterized protein n=1 Tax=Choristoneura fumiferana TaxID=7141 RepID=A0ACC0KJX5_CHOFU|nr:hypothetical protein MSG28_004402 [Choristoneura fumiferana]